MWPRLSHTLGCVCRDTFLVGGWPTGDAAAHRLEGSVRRPGSGASCPAAPLSPSPALEPRTGPTAAHCTPRRLSASVMGLTL